MFKPIPTALITLLMMSQPLLAQSQDAPADTDAAPAAEEAPATDAPAQIEAAPAEDPASDTATDADPSTDLNLGTTVEGDEALRPGQPYIREEFGSWALRCLRAEDGGDDPCQLYQLLMDDDGNAVAEFSTFPLPPGGEAAAGATIVVPLETLLTQNLRLAIDNSEPKVYPFTFCNPAGCVARVGFTTTEVNQLKRGAAATLRMVPAAAPDQEVVLNVSLSGFTAGFDSVDAE